LLVVRDLDVEIFEELSQLGGVVVGERVAQIGDRGEHRLDCVGVDVARRLRFE
jgi:hypothetical protein